MLKRSLMVLGLVGCISSYATAAVDLVVTTAGDDPLTSSIEVLPGDNTLSIALSSDAGPIANGGGLAFDFGATSGVTLSNFAWDAIFSNPDNWFADPTLPMPAVVSFAPALPIPAAPGSVIVASVVATFSGAPDGGISLPTGLQVFDQAGNNLPVDPTSGAINFNVIPEPATMALLIIGGLTAIRRRR